VADFEVDFDALGVLRDTCQQLAALFDGESHHAWAGQVALVGSESLGDALATFEGHWGDGRKKVKGHLTGLSDRVQGAIDGYQGSDRDLAAEIGDASR
jgi:hypothetical protein